MNQVSVPPEVAQRIARLADRRTLLVLARTSRTLQNAAERNIYESIEVLHSPQAFIICQSLSVTPRVAAHVKYFALTMLSGRGRDRSRDEMAMMAMHQTVALRPYWEVVRKALSNLTSLDFFFLSDPTHSNSWVLRPTENWRLRATEIRLYIPWDENIAAFMEKQDRTTSFCIADIAENVPVLPLSDCALPNLTQYEGPLMLVDQFLHCPITHLKLPVNTEDAVSLLPLLLPSLSRFRKLRSLSVLQMPIEMVESSVSSICSTCPQLSYLSVIPLLNDHKARATCLRHLSRLKHLQILEVDVSHWLPPVTGNYQRIFAVELRMVLPTIRHIFFWNRHDRWVWSWAPDTVEPVLNQQIAGGRHTEVDALTEDDPDVIVGLDGWSQQWSSGHWATHSNHWKEV